MNTEETPSLGILRPQEPFRFDEEQGLFVIGSARSGTTLLSETLNLSPQVFLLEEAFLYRDAKEPHFCSFFNRRHEEYGNPLFKGCYAPYFQGKDHTAWELLDQLAQRYRYVGEKVAMGPWVDWDEALLEFQAANFYRSQYVLTFRRPAEVVWSMVRKFPENPPSHHLFCCLRAFQVGVNFLAVFPRTYVVFHDRFTKSYLEGLCKVLGVEVILPEQMVAPPGQLPSSLAEGKLPSPLQPLEELLQQATTIYHRLQELVNAKTFRFCPVKRPRSYFRKFRAELAELEERLRQAVSQSEGNMARAA